MTPAPDAYRRTILDAERVAIGVTVLLIEHRVCEAGALPTDRKAGRQLKRDRPPGVSVALMNAMVMSFRDVADQHGVDGLRHAALVVARARLAV